MVQWGHSTTLNSNLRSIKLSTREIKPYSRNRLKALLLKEDQFSKLNSLCPLKAILEGLPRSVLPRILMMGNSLEESRSHLGGHQKDLSFWDLNSNQLFFPSQWYPSDP